MQVAVLLMAPIYRIRVNCQIIRCQLVHGVVLTQWNFKFWIKSELFIWNVEVLNKEKINNYYQFLINWTFCSWQKPTKFNCTIYTKCQWIIIYIHVKDLRPAYFVTWRQTWLQVYHFLLALLASVLKSHRFPKMPPQLVGNLLLGLQEINSTCFMFGV